MPQKLSRRLHSELNHNFWDNVNGCDKDIDLDYFCCVEAGDIWTPVAATGK